ncbi:hypothetical protein, partial [Mucilaginibacter dorajii]|uniref:hypothetical protein n=1 Tax=Mucilaginibacter dorajii TaxID=692994 RepID=UPI002169BC54
MPAVLQSSRIDASYLSMTGGRELFLQNGHSERLKNLFCAMPAVLQSSRIDASYLSMTGGRELFL